MKILLSRVVHTGKTMELMVAKSTSAFISIKKSVKHGCTQMDQRVALLLLHHL